MKHVTFGDDYIGTMTSTWYLHVYTFINIYTHTYYYYYLYLHEKTASFLLWTMRLEQYFIHSADMINNDIGI